MSLKPDQENFEPEEGQLELCKHFYLAGLQSDLSEELLAAGVLWEAELEKSCHGLF